MNLLFIIYYNEQFSLFNMQHFVKSEIFKADNLKVSYQLNNYIFPVWAFLLFQRYFEIIVLYFFVFIRYLTMSLAVMTVFIRWPRPRASFLTQNNMAPFVKLGKSLLLTIQQICSRRLWKHSVKNSENLYKWKKNYWTNFKINLAKWEIAHQEQFLIFSSTGQRPEGLMSWRCVRRPCVRACVRPCVRP